MSVWSFNGARRASAIYMPIWNYVQVVLLLGTVARLAKGRYFISDNRAA